MMHAARTRRGSWGQVVLLASAAILNQGCASHGGNGLTPGTGGAAAGGGGSGEGGSGGTGGSAGGGGGTGGSAGGGGTGTDGSASDGAGAGGSAGGAMGGGGGRDAGADTGAGVDASADGGARKFSFFVTSLAAMQRLSGNQQGFGGDLRFGQADGLAGADEICRTIAETSLPGSGGKGWRAFLSVTKDASGKAVNAIDRVGEGPWYDRLGRTVALTKANLAQPRPVGADVMIVNDLPNEDGVPNQAPDGKQVDNHDILTGSDQTGRLIGPDWRQTCHDWTSKVGSDGQPHVGHSWPRSGRGAGSPGLPGPGSLDSWMSALDEAGCAPGVNLIEMGPPDPAMPTVGSGGGYGGIYCFALRP
jgi:hypothetical protein